ncbi:MAG: ParB/RepB/Spo0J family partition protein [Clostridiales bacterium]|nr:ParB/RepB/Spo0J family partition protein [Clostridiales bacterium]
MSNKGLGRGLEALFGVFDEDKSYNNITKQPQEKTGVLEIEIDKIRPNPNQPRKNFDQEALKELAASIKIHGIVQPIVLNKQSDGSYLIIAGERRWRAANICGLKTVPAVIKTYTEKQVKEISIIENLQREDLNPVEAAKAIKELMEEYGLTQEVVAERIGKSRSNIANTLRLLNLYPDVLEMVEQGKLSAGHARCLVVIEDSKEQIRLAQQTVAKNLSVRDLEKSVKGLLNPAKKIVIKEEQSLELKELINQMQKTFATKVSAIGNDSKGRIYIDYYSRDDLDRIAELLELLNKKEMTLQDLQNYNKRNKN